MITNCSKVQQVCLCVTEHIIRERTLLKGFGCEIKYIGKYSTAKKLKFRSCPKLMSSKICILCKNNIAICS